MRWRKHGGRIVRQAAKNCKAGGEGGSEQVNKLETVFRVSRGRQIQVREIDITQLPVFPI